MPSPSITSFASAGVSSRRVMVQEAGNMLSARPKPKYVVMIDSPE